MNEPQAHGVASNELLAALCEAQECLRDTMQLIREIVIVKDVDIDHDEVWMRWVKAANTTGQAPATAKETR